MKIYIKCSGCGKELIALPMNAEYELLEDLIFCNDCKDDKYLE